MVGMLFGKTPGFSKDFYQALITTGTVHIVALSGMNISILTNMISKITLPLGRKISSIVSILAISGFIYFVGPSPTVVRAGIMGIISLIAVYFGRQQLSILSLLIAAVIMMIIDPQVISLISFQLSFLATLGIIIFAPQARRKKVNERNLYKSIWFDIKNIFRENFKTTLAAQVLTLPVIIFLFGRLSLISPLTNVLIGWTVTPIMILGILVIIGGLIFYPLGQLISWFSYVLLHYFVLVVEVTSKIPFASLMMQ